ncbi:hypothetical protein QN354_08405 [Cryobacterium sp. 5I3]|uniref:DUF7657 domain-containing protein n=1 Tax=Cryobacterium sp. 5I3 TaxID=3048592 RepID=UPI002B22C2C7|nr:hypothetical protein [Cryobacterium sp. 5I3]MEB0201777.1 hypothetical protein [Cryobacterium sp. 5I3]
MLVTSILIALGISGTSSGAHWLTLGSGVDPRLLEGAPRGIRSDEWLVQQSWVVSQFNRGFPVVNTMFPGGTDMTVLNELPSWDWSSLFRPHLWGYLFFGLNRGMAWHWWGPALILVSACYAFLVTLIPKRPFMASFLALALLFTPFLQWWYTPSSLLSVAWPLLAMAAVVWSLRDGRRWVRVVWACVTGYFAITLAMGLYVPYILPGLLVFIAFSVGYLLRLRPWRDRAVQATYRRLVPIVVAGAAAVAVVVVWAATRVSTFMAILSTVYPGQRLEATGGALAKDPVLAGLAGAPWNSALQTTSGVTALGLNSSEGSSVILLSLFVLPGLLWFIARSLRHRGQTDWLLICCVGALALVMAYLLVPGWDDLAHVIQFDRVPPERFRIIFVVLLPVFAALVIERVDASEVQSTWKLGAVSGLFAAGVIGAVWLYLHRTDPAVLVQAPDWKIVAFLIVLATFLFFVRGGSTVAAALILAATVLIGGGINPLYRGVYDLSKTATGLAVEQADEAKPGAWVGVGSAEAMAVLVESGVESFSGVQTYPAAEMWNEIDPSARYADKWNRLAHIHWGFGTGEPVVTNPQADVVLVTIDPCSSFAQEHVSYVLSDGAQEKSACLVEKSTIQQGLLEMRIYEVIPGN